MSRLYTVIASSVHFAAVSDIYECRNRKCLCRTALLYVRALDMCAVRIWSIQMTLKQYMSATIDKNKEKKVCGPCETINVRNKLCGGFCRHIETWYCFLQMKKHNYMSTIHKYFGVLHGAQNALPFVIENTEHHNFCMHRIRVALYLPDKNVYSLRHGHIASIFVLGLFATYSVRLRMPTNFTK